jgi:hypothetical protein
MPPFYKKRRRTGPSGPNKNELKVIRRNEADHRESARRPLGEAFHGVQKISLHMEFLTPQSQILDEQTRAFTANDFPNFLVECMGRCSGDGLFDLTPKIETAVAAREHRLQTSDICGHRIYPGSPDICGFRLQSKIDIAYTPA